MSDIFSPKQVATAIQVSESSVKRWCDKGAIPTQYTAGGHRRIRLTDILEFLRQTGHQLIEPKAFGLPGATGGRDSTLAEACKSMTAALIAGDESRCRQIAISAYLAEHSMGAICDEVFAGSFHDIGDQWACGRAEIYQERRGCEITLRLLQELRMLLPAPPAGAPLALGCTPAGDPYCLPTTMVELTLRDCKWNAVSLGVGLPLATIAAAIQDHQPRMLWLSCSHLEDEQQFLYQYEQLHGEFGLDVAFVVGGAALNEPLRRRMRFTAHCDNMRHLEGIAQSLFSPTW